ncbi:MAG: cell envelope biogenesis protein TolA [Pseudomonadota bacterium]
MERAEQAGLGVAALGHVALFAALSASFLGTPDAFEQSPALDVSLVDDVALTATAPAAVEPPAASIAPEIGAPEDAAPPEPADAAPEPAPPVKQQAAPPPKPAAVAKPQPRPVAAPAPSPAKATPKPAASAAVRSPAKPAVTRGAGTQIAATSPRQRGALLGDNFLKGVVADRNAPAARGQVAPAAVMSTQAAADIGSAIARQVQPCAERQQLSAPGAERITSMIQLNINRDGSLASRPTVIGHTGVDDGNARYVDRVDDLTIAAFMGCAPLRGLPADLYDVPRGWKRFKMRFKLP